MTEGARVVIADRDELDLRRVVETVCTPSPAAEIELMTGDLSEASGVARMFERVDEWLGGLDTLVACAGVGSGPLMEMAEPDWRYVIESNLSSYLACTQGASEQMRAANINHGRIILVGSISVPIKAVGESVYAASEGGVASPFARNSSPIGSD